MDFNSIEREVLGAAQGMGQQQAGQQGGFNAQQLEGLAGQFLGGQGGQQQQQQQQQPQGGFNPQQLEGLAGQFLGGGGQQQQGGGGLAGLASSFLGGGGGNAQAMEAKAMSDAMSGNLAGAAEDIAIAEFEQRL
ncbi:hypothetical protein Q8F55_006045 [Vanrija albida]|uniref:Uncharacterized protein n=1 Tax=Vanrija albida TaxID=181172 RepID=A0ABR3Q3M9_9TREE